MSEQDYFQQFAAWDVDDEPDSRDCYYCAGTGLDPDGFHDCPECLAKYGSEEDMYRWAHEVLYGEQERQIELQREREFEKWLASFRDDED